MESLKNIVDGDTLYEFYFDGSGRRFDVGYILYSDEEWALIELISPEGGHEGYRLVFADEIVMLQYGTQYLEKLADLMAARHTERKPLEFSGSGLFGSVMDFVMTNRFVCTVELAGERAFTEHGFIEKIGIDTFRMELIDEYGKPDGHMVAELADVSAVTFNSSEERNLALLNLFRK